MVNTNMKVVVFVIIILLVIAAYSFIDQYFKTGSFLSPVKEPVEKEQAVSSNSPKNQYYVPAEKSEEKTENVKPAVSPYIERIRLSNVQKASPYSPSLIALNISPYKGEPINLTGFTIKTRKGNYIIPQGIEKYKSNAGSSDIIISEPLIVYLAGINNPLGFDKNFRANKCFGYLAKAKDIYPFPSAYCPAPELEQTTGLNPYCQEFLIRQYGCQAPDYSQDLKISTDSQCVSYILDFYSYDGCFRKSRNDSDFLLDYWYIYLGKNIVEELHDTIYIYDRDNLLIDKYVY